MEGDPYEASSFEVLRAKWIEDSKKIYGDFHTSMGARDTHKCNIVARTTRLPAHDDILKLLELGLRIPAGKANQFIHKREWAPLIPAE